MSSKPCNRSRQAQCEHDEVGRCVRGVGAHGQPSDLVACHHERTIVGDQVLQGGVGVEVERLPPAGLALVGRGDGAARGGMAQFERGVR